MNIKFRKATLYDLDFIFNLKKENYYDYVNKLWGWNDKEQFKRTQENFEKYADTQTIITLNNEDIGLFVKHITKENEYYLNEIIITKKYQNKGIGTKIIKDIIKNEKVIILQVFKDNPARRLYERLGFKIFEETESHYKMRKE